jgi:hypothetical protein
MRNPLSDCSAILHLQKRKITTALIIANMCLLTIFVSGWSYSEPSSQDNRKVVEKHWAPENEPTDITEPRIKARGIKLGETFEDESDWLKHLTFKVKNRSDRPITFFQIDLDFPETKATGNIMMHQLFIGRRSDFTSTRNNPPLYLKPNEAIEISLEPEYNAIKRLIELRGLPVESINKLGIRTSEAMFEDETLYHGGAIFKRNPDLNSPRKWLPISDGFGRPLNN